MQKKIIALAVAGLASTAAMAQSNVTVYGVVDAGLAHVSATGAKGTNAVVSGGLAGSRLGFKGTEDLGNGLKALFTLEYALAVDQNSFVGDQSSNAARQQFVGLTGGFGTAVAGYLQTAGYDFACAANPLAGSALDALNLLGQSSLLTCGAKGRAGNAVAYISPSFSGVTFALNHARITETAFTGTPDLYANLLAVNYANGPISAGFVMSKIAGNGTGVAETNTNYIGGAAGAASASTLANYDVNEMGIRGSYDFGVAKLMGSYQTADNKDPAKPGKNKKYAANVVVPVGATNLIAQYAANKVDETTATDNSKGWALAATHSLSKRTTAYVGYTHITNDSGAKLGAFGIYSAGNTDPFGGKSSVMPSLGGSSSLFATGLNHSF